MQIIKLICGIKENIIKIVFGKGRKVKISPKSGVKRLKYLIIISPYLIEEIYIKKNHVIENKHKIYNKILKKTAEYQKEKNNSNYEMIKTIIKGISIIYK